MRLCMLNVLEIVLWRSKHIYYAKTKGYVSAVLGFCLCKVRRDPNDVCFSWMHNATDSTNQFPVRCFLSLTNCARFPAFWAIITERVRETWREEDRNMCNNSQLVRLIECKQRSKSTESVRSNVALETKTNQREKNINEQLFCLLALWRRSLQKKLSFPHLSIFAVWTLNGSAIR